MSYDKVILTLRLVAQGSCVVPSHGRPLHWPCAILYLSARPPRRHRHSYPRGRSNLRMIGYVVTCFPSHSGESNSRRRRTRNDQPHEPSQASVCQVFPRSRIRNVMSRLQRLRESGDTVSVCHLKSLRLCRHTSKPPPLLPSHNTPLAS